MGQMGGSPKSPQTIISDAKAIEEGLEEIMGLDNGVSLEAITKSHEQRKSWADVIRKNYSLPETFDVTGHELLGFVEEKVLENIEQGRHFYFLLYGLEDDPEVEYFMRSKKVQEALRKSIVLRLARGGQISDITEYSTEATRNYFRTAGDVQDAIKNSILSKANSDDVPLYTSDLYLRELQGQPVYYLNKDTVKGSEQLQALFQEKVDEYKPHRTDGINTHENNRSQVGPEIYKIIKDLIA